MEAEYTQMRIYEGGLESMPFCLNLKRGTIHSSHDMCQWGKKLKDGDFAEYATLHEAEMQARDRKLTPTLCKRCKYREDMQLEIKK